MIHSYLGEADVCGLLTEALAADVESIFANETGLVGADTAVKQSVLIFSAFHNPSRVLKYSS
jgi:hypothetical protein